MIANTGYWTFQGQRFEHEHVYDPGVSDALVVFAKSLGVTKSYDFGCGPGKYVENFRKAGIETDGFDGNPITSRIPNCYVRDLTTDFQFPKVDFLVCLEVCEHVPVQYENNLIKTLDRHLNSGGKLVLSWAVVGQGGTGHVNCRNNDYVVNKFESLGYTYMENESNHIRKQVLSAPWFKNTILIFNKNG